MKKTVALKKLVTTALLMAMSIVLVRYLGVTTDLVKINFGFLPLTAAAMLYGPVWGGCTFAVADVVGMLIAGGGKTYFPLFTVSEFLYGVAYGLILHKKEKTLARVSFAVILTTVVINLMITPVWNMLYMKLIMGKTLTYRAVVATKLIPAAILAPVKIISIYMLWRYCGKSMEKYAN